MRYRLKELGKPQKATKIIFNRIITLFTIIKYLSTTASNMKQVKTDI